MIAPTLTRNSGHARDCALVAAGPARLKSTRPTSARRGFFSPRYARGRRLSPRTPDARNRGDQRRGVGERLAKRVLRGRTCRLEIRSGGWSYSRVRSLFCAEAFERAEAQRRGSCIAAISLALFHELLWGYKSKSNEFYRNCYVKS